MYVALSKISSLSIRLLTMMTSVRPFVSQADRMEPYTRITPFQEKHDTSIE